MLKLSTWVATLLLMSSCSNIITDKIIIDDTQQLAASTHIIAYDGRKIKEHIKDLFAQCKETRGIPTDKVFLTFDNTSLKNLKINCGGSKNLNTSESRYEASTSPIILSKISPIARFRLPAGIMAVLLPEGFVKDDGVKIIKGKISVNMIPKI
jgi:hypothetical protein